MKHFGLSAAILATALAAPLQAQTRDRAPQPTTQPGLSVRAPAVNPIVERLAAVEAELAALKESAGKQVVALHFTPSELPGWLDNNFSSNQQRSSDLCEQALGDRFGRVLSYRIWNNEDRFFFSHVICETQL